MYKTLNRIAFAGLLFHTTACGDHFLGVKQDQSLAIPATLDDYRAILDNSRFMNINSCHELGTLGSDELYISDQRLASAPDAYQRSAYLWERDVFGLGEVRDWNYTYKRIFHANIVLDGMSRLVPPSGKSGDRDDVIGSALFHRAFDFFQLAQQFCKQYHPGTANDDPGIPLRLEADITLAPTRASVAETYRRITSDLERAASLLPETALVKERPSRPAAHALLARVYLQMGLYAEALANAQKSLEIQGMLLDYKQLEIPENTSNVFSGQRQSNPEVLFHASAASLRIAPSTHFRVDTVLYGSYEPGDLRRDVFFRKHSNGTSDIFRGTYSGDGLRFTGLAVDEVVLVRAECLLRLGRKVEALADLNHLLLHRYDAGFVPLESTDSVQILDWILEERKRELIFRGVRWSDLRRLNMESRYAGSLVRVVEGVRYELPPGDPRYVWPLPEETVRLSGLEQNVR